jgi:hypothetical protein
LLFGIGHGGGLFGCRISLDQRRLSQHRDIADPLDQPCRRIDPRRIVEQPRRRASRTGAPVGNRRKPP